MGVGWKSPKIVNPSKILLLLVYTILMSNILKTLHSTSEIWQKNCIENLNVKCSYQTLHLTIMKDMHAVNQELTHQLRNAPTLMELTAKIWNRATYTMIDTFKEIKYKGKQYQQSNFLQKRSTKKCPINIQKILKSIMISQEKYTSINS